MRKLTTTLCLALAVLLGLIFMFLTPSDALAGKSKSVSQDDTPVLLKGWPSAMDWRFYELGYTPNYSTERWLVIGQAGYGQMKNTTWMIVSQIQPGWYINSGYPDDIREAYWFTQEKGYFRKFSNTKWEKGQRFECQNDKKCEFRNLKFTAKNETCQWVFDNTDMDTTFYIRTKTDSWRVVLIHCGDTKPFEEKHFDRIKETIKITYPGSTGKVSPPQTKPTQIPSNLPLDKAEKKCAEIGFTKGTEKFGDCVMKLLN